MPRLRCLLLLSLAMVATPVLAAPDAPVQALWKHQQLQFYFQSFNTFYSCTGLEEAVRRYLQPLVGQVEVRVNSPECPGGIARMPRVRLEIISAVPATEAALAEQEEQRSKRELVQRLRGRTSATFDSLEPFPANWERIALARRLDVATGDCELIEQLQRKILPQLAVRLIDDGPRCAGSIGQPRLQVEALVALPSADDAQKR